MVRGGNPAFLSGCSVMSAIDGTLGLLFYAALFGTIRYAGQIFLDPFDFEATQQMFLCLFFVWVLFIIISARGFGEPMVRSAGRLNDG